MDDISTPLVVEVFVIYEAPYCTFKANKATEVDTRLFFVIQPIIFGVLFVVPVIVF